MISITEWEERFDRRRAQLREHPELLMRCTERQAGLLRDHYLGYKTLTALAKRDGVCLSTISRTIENGWKRVEEVKEWKTL